MKKRYRCGCGAWTGEQCTWTGDVSDMVVVEYVPVAVRASARAAYGYDASDMTPVFPVSFAERIAVERNCADLLLSDEAEQDWARLVDTDPARYTVSE